jgi:ribonuclease HI
MIEIFTDGASSGNPGPGGYGAILRSGQHYKELSEGYRKTTNNRMELLAVIKALEALKNPNQTVTIYSDSKYVIDAIEKRWVYGWLQKGFKDKKNKDLWLRYLELSKLHHINFVWVRGHNGHAENERCDQLAVAAYKQKNLLIDSVFEVENARINLL